MKRAKYITLSAVAAFVLAGCGNSDVDRTAVEADTTMAQAASQAADKPAATYDGTISKPGSPFKVSYKIVGTPIVGSPVTVNLMVTSSLGTQPVTVNYRINDASSMMFNEAQPSKVEISPAANDKGRIPQQVTLIPQREGRMYLNVETAVETKEGSMSSVIAIPLQVGEGGRSLEKNGEVEIDEDGEAVRVLTSE